MSAAAMRDVAFVALEVVALALSACMVRLWLWWRGAT